MNPHPVDPSSFARGLRGPLQELGEFLLTCRDLQWTGYSFAALHRPRIAPEYFAVEIWPGLPKADIERYASSQGIVIPPAHTDFLRRGNGVRVGTFTLYGIPPSMLLTPPMLDRRARQPLDVGAANQLWLRGYPSCKTMFHLGSAKYSYREHAGLFQSPEGAIAAVLQGGSVVGSWPTYRELVNAGVSSVTRGADPVLSANRRHRPLK